MPEILMMRPVSGRWSPIMWESPARCERLGRSALLAHVMKDIATTYDNGVCGCTQ